MAHHYEDDYPVALKSSKLPELFFHVAAEFFGAIVIFFILEHSIQRIEQLANSGITEKPRLPIKEFIQNISNATSEILILDTYLDSFVVNEENWYEFQKAISKAMQNKSVIVKVLILKPETPPAKQRAVELNANSPEKVEAAMKIGLNRLGFV